MNGESLSLGSALNSGFCFRYYIQRLFNKQINKFEGENLYETQITRFILWNYVDYIMSNLIKDFLNGWVSIKEMYIFTLYKDVVFYDTYTIKLL